MIASATPQTQAARGGWSYRPPPGVLPHGAIRRPVLDEERCAAAVAELFTLRSQWTQRFAQLPLFTLGAASYHDGLASPDRYLELAGRFNPLLRRHFGSLLDAVARTVSDALGLETAWHPQAALPGFHIYLGHAVFSLPVAPIHFDKQYFLVGWEEMPDVDFSTPVSFTLPIALPDTGGGLNVWDIGIDELARSTPQMRTEAVRGRAPVFHPYRLGELFMHSGHVLHQAALGACGDTAARRITLQGHGVRCGSRVYLYW